MKAIYARQQLLYRLYAVVIALLLFTIFAAGHPGETSISAQRPSITLPVSEAVVGSEVTISYDDFPGNTKDWIGLYLTTAGDKQAVSWQYTNGRKNGTMVFRFPATEGTYEFRAYVNDGYTQLCKSGIVQVKLIINNQAVITVPFSQAVTGSEMTIRFSEFPGNTKDWIGLYLTTAGEKEAVSWQYTNGRKNGTMVFRFPATEGKYEFRAYVNDGYTQFCKSGVVDVRIIINNQAVITVPSYQAVTGKEMTISYSEFPGNTKDWIGLYLTTAGEKQAVSWQYTNGKKNGSMTFQLPATEGKYEFRSFVNDGYTLLCKSGVVTVEKIVTYHPVITTPSLQTFTGSKITIGYSDFPGNARDWIGLYQTTAGDKQAVSWQYTDGRKNGSMVFQFPATEGKYEFRSFANDGYTLLCKSGVVTVEKIVTNKPAITIPSIQAVTGSKMTISYSDFPGNTKDWIGLYLTTAGEKQAVSWQYTNGKKNGSMVFQFPATEGKYEFRSFVNDGYTLLCKSGVIDLKFILNNNAVIAVPSSQAFTGNTMTISYSDFPGNTKDWIGLYLTTAGDKQAVSWQYTNGKKNGSMVFRLPATEGKYEFRSFINDGYILLCKSGTVLLQKR